MHDDEEKWRPVISYEDLYEVSNAGRVRSLDRFTPSKAGSTQLRKGKMLSGCVGGSGYVQVVLVRDKTKQNYLVHRLVAESFVDNADASKSHVHHMDHDRTNNNAANLQWVTQAENSRYSSRDGRLGKILTHEREAIVRLKQSGVSSKDIANRFRISPRYVCQLSAGYRRVMDA